MHANRLLFGVLLTKRVHVWLGVKCKSALPSGPEELLVSPLTAIANAGRGCEVGPMMLRSKWRCGRS